MVESFHKVWNLMFLAVLVVSQVQLVRYSYDMNYVNCCQIVKWVIADTNFASTLFKVFFVQKRLQFSTALSIPRHFV